MNTLGLFEVLAQCQAEGIRLMMRNGGLRRSPNASPELVALLRENREALKAIVGSASWPWLSDPACVLAGARCKCGKRPWQFTALGEPICETPEKPLDDDISPGI